MTMHKRTVSAKTLISLAVLTLLTVLAVTPMALAAERTGNTWIFPITDYSSLGCKYDCRCSEGKIDSDTGKEVTYHTIENIHPGYDLRAAAGTPVVAARSGVVVKQWETCTGTHWNVKDDCTSAGGNYVKIQHEDGSYANYFHMKAAAVKVDDWVEQGDIIGYVGQTGNASGPHVCFEYRNTSNKTTAHVNTIVGNTAAGNCGTAYYPGLYKTTVNVAMWSATVKDQRTQVTTVPEGTEILCTVIQEGYGFAEYNGYSGWVDIHKSAELKQNAIQFDYYKNSGSGKMSNTTHLLGNDIKIPANKFTRTGYAFTGWELYKPYNKQWLYSDGTSYGWYVSGKQPSGWSKVRYDDGATIPADVHLASNGKTLIRLKACWTEVGAPKYTIQFNANGGTGTMADLPGTTGVRNVLTRCAFTRQGFAFVGWTATRKSDGKWLFNAELEDGSYGARWHTKEAGEAAGWELFRYADGGATTSPTQTDGDVLTFYAQWTASALKLDAKNGEAAQYCDFEKGTPLGQLPIPQKEGNHFLGWFTESGKQVTSLTLPEDSILSGVDTVYARWLPHGDRPVLERYVDRAPTTSRYAHALSQLMTAAGQQDDKTYTEAQCLEDLDSVGMLTASGGVKNSSFGTTGFLEYFAPELTYEGKFTCDSYAAYVTELAKKQESGHYMLVNLQLNKDTTQWVYVYEADGESLLVLYDGQIVDAAEIATGISSANLFLYHGSDLYVQRPALMGSYSYAKGTLTVDLSCSAAPVEAGKQTVCIACYTENGQMVAFRRADIKLDGYLNGTVSVSVPVDFDRCSVFILKDWKPLCESIELQEA